MPHVMPSRRSFWELDDKHPELRAVCTEGIDLRRELRREVEKSTTMDRPRSLRKVLSWVSAWTQQCDISLTVGEVVDSVTATPDWARRH